MKKKREKNPGFRKLFESFNVFTAYRVMQTLQFTSACMHQAGLHINRHVIQKNFNTHTTKIQWPILYTASKPTCNTHRQTHISYRHIKQNAGRYLSIFHKNS